MEYRGYKIEVVGDEFFLTRGSERRHQYPPFVPVDGETTIDKAKIFVDQLIEAQEQTAQEQYSITQLKQQLAETQDALIELAAIVAGGAN